MIPPEPKTETERNEHASARIMVVDDVAAIRYSIGKTLQRIGGQVSTAGNAQEALKLMAEQTYDVILSDIRLPDLNGVELLARIRSQAPDTVVILMTGYASLDTAIDAMRLGAFDYLVKPSDNQDIRRSVTRGLEHARELKRRSALLDAIQANVRELTNGKPSEMPRNKPLFRESAVASIPSSATITIGKLTIYPSRSEIGIDDQKILMTPTEFDLLLYLVAHKGRVVSCQELVREVRGYAANEVEAREVIRPHISNLRRKLNQTGQKDMIVNVRGYGYRLTDSEANAEADEV